MAGFGGITVGNYLAFQNNAEIEGPANFIQARVGGSARFDGITINNDCYFERVTIEEDCFFAGANIKNDLRLPLLEVRGELSFRDAHFSLLEVEEKACRAAKQNCEGRGAREDADYYFYREMAARRKQKKQPVKSLELIVQYALGYGVYPSRLVITWVFIAFASGTTLALANGLLNNSWQFGNIGFGIVAAFVPGYAILQAQPGISQWIAGIETVMGAFLWAAFIAVFSRKYMR